MVYEPEEYRWSSIHAYYKAGEYPCELCESAFVLGVFDKDRQRAIQVFRKFMKRENGTEKAKRNKILREIKAIGGESLRQISRVTGLSVDIFYNA